MQFRQQALDALIQTNPLGKCGLTAAIKLLNADGIEIGPLVQSGEIPGRESRPALVAPKELKRRSLKDTEGRAALIHALAHIELNAVNLALDILWRFDRLPLKFYQDWLQVAHEEAKHFLLLDAHLKAMGFEYGDFPAHNSLWEMAEKTKDDLLARLALVPRTLEARGLDATPQVRRKLFDAGDHAGADILDVILSDEIGHVAVGNYWYRWECKRRGLEPVSTFQALAKQYKAPRPNPPLNIAGRKAAGFTEEEIQMLLS